MIKIRDFLIKFVFAACVGAGCNASAQSQGDPALDLRQASYDGKWSGTVNCLHDPGLWPEDECAVRFILDIQGNRIKIDQVIRSKKGKETKSAIDTEKFVVARFATNAVAISMDSGKDEDGTWVETWSFAMTLTDQDHMLVHWTRIVNNIDMPLAKKGSKFSSVGMGEFARIGVGI
jgi:predicted 3-demethylubiquinone-9 3-methyltransferase (glyoxalase superfamily)